MQFLIQNLTMVNHQVLFVKPTAHKMSIILDKKVTTLSFIKLARVYQHVYQAIYLQLFMEKVV